MKIMLAAAALCLLPFTGACAAEVQHFAAGAAPVPGASGPAFSASVMAGNTLYVSGVLDSAPGAPGRMGADPEEGARFVLDNLKRGVEAGGLSMDDLVFVQVFATDLTWYAKFNEVYRTYFAGPLPARAFVGTSQLLNGAHFEALGIAVKK